MTKLRWVLAGVVGVVLLVVGGTWVYINVVRDDPPPPLALSDTDADTDAAADPAGPASAAADSESDEDAGARGTTTDRIDDAAPIEGEWEATAESVAGYRVGEILFGQGTEAVGRTDQVEGSITVEGTTVTAAAFEVDMASVESDESRRDAQFRGRIMDVESHPTASLRLRGSIPIDGEPSDGEAFVVAAPAELTLRGTTRDVTIDLEARRTGGRVEVVGALPVVFEEWGIPDPSAPGIDTEDEGLLEVHLVLERVG